MRTPDFYAKVGETFDIEFWLKDARGLVDLTDAIAVKLNLRPAGGGARIYDGVDCDFDADPSGHAWYTSPAVITFPAGLYLIDFEAHYPGTPPLVDKFPNGGPKPDDSFYLVKISPAD